MLTVDRVACARLSCSSVDNLGKSHAKWDAFGSQTSVPKSSEAQAPSTGQPPRTESGVSQESIKRPNGRVDSFPSEGYKGIARESAESSTRLNSLRSGRRLHLEDINQNVFEGVKAAVRNHNAPFVQCGLTD